MVTLVAWFTLVLEANCIRILLSLLFPLLFLILKWGKRRKQQENRTLAWNKISHVTKTTTLWLKQPIRFYSPWIKFPTLPSCTLSVFAYWWQQRHGKAECVFKFMFTCTYIASQAFRACLLYINVQGKAWRDLVTCLNVLNNQLYWCCLANGPVSSPLTGNYKGAQDSSSDKAPCVSTLALTPLHITLHVSSRPSLLCICILKAMKDLRQQAWKQG